MRHSIDVGLRGKSRTSGCTSGTHVFERFVGVGYELDGQLNSWLHDTSHTVGFPHTAPSIAVDFKHESTNNIVKQSTCADLDIGCAGVEVLAERHDVQSSLAKGWADRRSGLSLSSRNKQPHKRFDCLLGGHREL